MICKNGYKFEIVIDELEVDREESKEYSYYNGYETAVVKFNIRVTEITKEERFNYELVGYIEYSKDGADVSFYDGTNYVNNVTLVGGDEQDRSFNQAVKDFFAEDCEFEALVWDNLSDEQRDDVENLIG
jgi:hypothetical protein